CRQHVLMGNDAVQHRASLDLAGPAHERRNAPGALPVRVLAAAEQRVAAIGPCVVLGTIVGGVHDDGIVGDAQFVKLVEHLTDLLIVRYHAIAVIVLSAFSTVLVCEMSSEMHSRRVVPEEEWFVLFDLLLHPAERS